MRLNALFTLGFPSAPALHGLNLAPHSNSPGHYAKGTQSLRPKTWSSYCLKVHGFRYCFTPLTGVLFNIRSRYSYAIGRQKILSLGGWTPRIQTRFHVTGPTRVSVGRPHDFAYGAVTLYRRPFQARSATMWFYHFLRLPRPLTDPTTLHTQRCGPYMYGV